MKSRNFDRVKRIMDLIYKYERIITETNNPGLLPTVCINQLTAEIPAEHGRFLKRVIRDHYQGKINKLQSELELL